MHRGNRYRDTIYALSSGVPPTGVAVIRISGPDTQFGLETLVGEVPQPRMARLKSIRNRNGLLLDSGLVLFFSAPSSFTGEDCAELHVHGGRAVIGAVTDALREIEGFRYAEAGEFTRRAFENGKIDLTMVEGLSDLVMAQTEMQRRTALAQAAGGLHDRYKAWMRRLTRCRGLIEAGLDFSDEGDVPEDVSAGVRADLKDVRLEIASHLDKSRAGEIVREGCHVAIAGAPNAGKSSLLNALARRDVSIVSDEAGTTRDVVTVTLDLGGYAVILHDTAGLREATGKVEQEGIRRAQMTMEMADLVLYLRDLAGDEPETGLPLEKTLIVGTKADLKHEPVTWRRDVEICVPRGDGLDELIALMMGRIEQTAARLSDAIPTRARHQAQLGRTLECLDAVLLQDELPAEFMAEELRAASEALGRLTGQVDAEDLLDVIFASFCIGK